MTEIEEIRLVKRLGYKPPLEVRLIDLLSVNNAMSFARLAELTGTTRKSVNAAINRLERAGVLRRTRIGQYGCVPMRYEIEALDMTG